MAATSAAAEPVSDRLRTGAPGDGLDRVVAVLAVLAMTIDVKLHELVPLGYAVAIAALPVTVAHARRFRGGLLLLSTAVVAVAGGLALAWATGPPAYDGLDSIAVGQASRVLMVGVGAVLLLWCRSVLGTRRLVLVYALGTFVSVALDGVNPVNPWKFSLALPLVLLLLSLPRVYRHSLAEVVVLFGLGLVSATQDSRSAAATMLLAGALVVTRRGVASRRVRSWVMAVRLGLFGLGGFLLLQAALLNGDLGEEVRQRTMEQAEASGSVLLGGRPEIGATWSLVRDQPCGFGIGTTPTPSQVMVAKTGMASLGYEPDNGYVENYMFGQGFEVHSVVGDLWLLAGIPGLALALLAIWLLGTGLSRQLGDRTASGLLIYLSIRAAWDLGFAPLYSALPVLMLVLALSMRERAHPPPPESGTTWEPTPASASHS